MEERAKRKLSAILSADVKGYSRLMEEDELELANRVQAHVCKKPRNLGGCIVT